MYSISSKVRYSECDSQSLLTIPALINYLQDCSTFHTESTGHGLEYCAKHHFSWFIAAWQIRINRLPRFCENICVSTYSYASRATMANRNFTVRTEEDELLVEADSLWFPFDTLKGRPIRIPGSEEIYFVDKKAVDLPPTRRKLRLEGTGIPQRSILVAEHHLDSNNHVNNGQYISMAYHVAHAIDDSFNIGAMYVQYKNAAKLGDTILPYLYQEQNGYAVDLANEDGVSYAIVRMERK